MVFREREECGNVGMLECGNDKKFGKQVTRRD
jgi:hypothetical protein